MYEKRVSWRTSSFCGEAGCVEVGAPVEHQGVMCVPVRSTNFPMLVAHVPVDQWEQLVSQAQATGKLNLADWFPAEVYGPFAGLFTEVEVRDFCAGILADEFGLRVLAA